MGEETVATEIEKTETKVPEPVQETALQPIVTGKTAIKKKSEGRKFIDNFFKGDLNRVTESIWKDVLVPAIKDMLWGAVERAGKGMIYGDTESDRRNDRNSIPARQVDFTRYSRTARPARNYDVDRDREDVYDYGEVFVESRRDAEAVQDRLKELCDRYGWVSVAQLYELTGLPTRYTDRNYGWRDVRDISITTTRGGYLIKLPRPRPFD